jgi:hypothetical protein
MLWSATPEDNVYHKDAIYKLQMKEINAYVSLHTFEGMTGLLYHLIRMY